MDAFYEDFAQAARQQVKRKRDLYEADTCISDEDSFAFHALLLQYEKNPLVNDTLKKLKDMPREEHETRGYMNRMLVIMYKMSLRETQQEMRELKQRQEQTEHQLKVLEPIGLILKENELLKETLTDLARHAEQQQADAKQQMEKMHADWKAYADQLQGELTREKTANENRVAVISERLARERKEACERTRGKIDASHGQVQVALQRLVNAHPNSPAVHEFMDTFIEVMEDIRLANETW